jgi:hypothetical protein
MLPPQESLHRIEHTHMVDSWNMPGKRLQQEVGQSLLMPILICTSDYNRLTHRCLLSLRPGL